MIMNGVQIRNFFTGEMQWWAVQALPPKEFNRAYHEVFPGKKKVDAQAFCDFNLKHIVIRARAKKDCTGNAVHEVLHAVFPFLTEDAVLAGEEAIISLLHTLREISEGKE